MPPQLRFTPLGQAGLPRLLSYVIEDEIMTGRTRGAMDLVASVLESCEAEMLQLKLDYENCGTVKPFRDAN